MKPGDAFLMNDPYLGGMHLCNRRSRRFEKY